MDPVLCRGIITECFHSRGKIPDFNERLKRFNISRGISFPPKEIRAGGKPNESGVNDLVVLDEIARTSFRVTSTELTVVELGDL